MHAKVKVDLLVTKHAALREVLAEHPALDLSEAKVLAHASEADVQGKVVAGMLPMRPAARARRFFELTLDLPAHLRGQELSVQQLREHLVGLTEYTVIDHSRQQLVAVVEGDDLAWVGARVLKVGRGEAAPGRMPEGVDLKAGVVKSDLFGIGYWPSVLSVCPICGHGDYAVGYECPGCGTR